MEKRFDKKNCGKINYKRKIRTGRKTGSNENVCGIWFKICSVARSHWTQVMWRFERSRDKRYKHGLRTVGNSLTTWAVSASSVVRKILVRACLHDEAAEHCVPQKRAGRRLYRIQLYTVITLHTQLNTTLLYMVTTRHCTTLHVHNSIQHNSTRHNSTRHNSTHHNSTRPLFNTPQLYTDHKSIRLKLL